MRESLPVFDQTTRRGEAEFTDDSADGGPVSAGLPERMYLDIEINTVDFDRPDQSFYVTFTGSVDSGAPDLVDCDDTTWAEGTSSDSAMPPVVPDRATPLEFAASARPPPCRTKPSLVLPGDGA